MASKIKVLIFPAGEINAVELHDALATCVNIDLFGASSVDRHGEYIFSQYISKLPLISDPGFFDAFNNILDKYHIDVIFPTHDSVAEFFAEHLSELHAKVIVADSKTAEVCRDKALTYRLFADEDFCPRVFPVPVEFPCFVKPRKGQGSVGAKLLMTRDDLPDQTDWSAHVVCEYLPGEEYTVDCFTDHHSVLRTIMPRSRQRIMAGISVAARDEPLTAEISRIAEHINSRLAFNGLWWFQIKKAADGRFKLLEISTRCAGTMCMARAMGVNLPLLSVYNAMGYDVSVRPNTYHVTMDRTLISRYKLDYDYNTVYFDFDDTLTMRGKVHLPAIRYLYQCRNQNKRVILLTRHENDIFTTLRQFCISPELFEKIISIGQSEKKADYIRPEKAIFIDNAHSERASVAERFGIPVFDVDGIEILLDWRI